MLLILFPVVGVALVTGTGVVVLVFVSVEFCLAHPEGSLFWPIDLLGRFSRRTFSIIFVTKLSCSVAIVCRVVDYRCFASLSLLLFPLSTPLFHLRLGGSAWHESERCFV